MGAGPQPRLPGAHECASELEHPPLPWGGVPWPGIRGGPQEVFRGSYGAKGCMTSESFCRVLLLDGALSDMLPGLALNSRRRPVVTEVLRPRGAAERKHSNNLLKQSSSSSEAQIHMQSLMPLESRITIAMKFATFRYRALSRRRSALEVRRGGTPVFSGAFLQCPAGTTKQTA